MATTPEGRVKKAVKLWLADHGIWYYAPVQMGMGVVGIPDFICCKPTLITEDMVGRTIGVFLAIETKAPGKLKEVTPNQAARLYEISMAHGVACVIDDVDSLNTLKENSNAERMEMEASST